jgi:hypothetical protein
MTGCLAAGTALSPLSIHHLPRHLYVKEGGILMLGRSGLYRLQPALVCRVRATIESICGP